LRGQNKEDEFNEGRKLTISSKKQKQNKRMEIKEN
jgi:hypothetical protein